MYLISFLNSNIKNKIEKIIGICWKNALIGFWIRNDRFICTFIGQLFLIKIYIDLVMDTIGYFLK